MEVLYTGICHTDLHQAKSQFTWENDGRLEHARQMAGHESPRTTKLYDRTKDEVTCARWSASDCDVGF
jgi:uncharacterized cupin superfamily protein